MVHCPKNNLHMKAKHFTEGADAPVICLDFLPDVTVYVNELLRIRGRLVFLKRRIRLFSGQCAGSASHP